MTDATNCPPCPSCKVPCGVPFITHQNQRGGDHDPSHLICAACGHDWIQADLDRVAPRWRAEAANWRTR